MAKNLTTVLLFFIYRIHRLYLKKHTYPPDGVVHIVNIETQPEENYETDNKQLTQIRHSKSYHLQTDIAELFMRRKT